MLLAQIYTAIDAIWHLYHGHLEFSLRVENRKCHGCVLCAVYSRYAINATFNIAICCVGLRFRS